MPTVYRRVENFDGYRLFNYLMENILMDGHYLLPNTVLPLKLDGLNFDGLAGRCQECQYFPLYDNN